MRYVTIKELSDMIRRNLWKIPHDIDLVVGIPRSGMMVANMIALYLNKRLTDIDSFIKGSVFECGERGKYVGEKGIYKVLVVDDSVYSGGAMTKAKLKLEPLVNQFEFVFASPIITTLGRDFVDVFFEVIDDERVFEWNLFHHGILNHSCLDIDGVLCCDPEEDDDGEKYLAFVNNAKPLFTPTVTVDTLISCRLEKYRKQTEEWLKKNNISYRQLVMLDLPDKNSRIRWGRHGEYKGEYYRSRDFQLFIESSYCQASIIAKVSNKPVICLETNELLFFLPEVTRSQKIKRKIKKRLPRTCRLMKRLFASDKVVDLF